MRGRGTTGTTSYIRRRAKMAHNLLASAIAHGVKYRIKLLFD